MISSWHTDSDTVIPVAIIEKVIPDYMHPLLNPKCYQVGCSEDTNKDFAKCRKATSYMPWYDATTQERLNSQRQNEIMKAV